MPISWKHSYFWELSRCIPTEKWQTLLSIWVRHWGNYRSPWYCNFREAVGSLKTLNFHTCYVQHTTVTHWLLLSPSRSSFIFLFRCLYVWLSFSLFPHHLKQIYVCVRIGVGSFMKRFTAFALPDWYIAVIFRAHIFHRFIFFLFFSFNNFAFATAKPINDLHVV